MALINCPECGNQVSSKASFCPKCGCPIENGNYEEVNVNQPLVANEPTWVSELEQKYKKSRTIWIVLLFIPPIFTLIGIFYLISHFVKKQVSGSWIVVKTNLTSAVIYVNGEIVHKSIGYTEYYHNFRDGTSVHIHFSKWDNSPTIHVETPPQVVHTQNVYVTENNTVVKERKKTPNSDMERILIKNAKIDALASIDPNNTEDAKKKIELVNQLDDLND